MISTFLDRSSLGRLRLRQSSGMFIPRQLLLFPLLLIVQAVRRPGNRLQPRRFNRASASNTLAVFICSQALQSVPHFFQSPGQRRRFLQRFGCNLRSSRLIGGIPHLGFPVARASPSRLARVDSSSCSFTRNRCSTCFKFIKLVWSVGSDPWRPHHLQYSSKPASAISHPAAQSASAATRRLQ